MAKTSSFVERFNLLLSRSGKSDSSLAADLGVSKQAISAWKTGTRSPKRPAIKDIANYFGVDISWLMGIDEGDYIYSDAFRENAHLFLSMNDPADIEAAAKDGTDIGLVNRVVNGSGALTLDAACRVADILDKTVDFIIDPEKNEESAPIDESGLKESLRSSIEQLDDESQNAVRLFVEFLLSRRSKTD